MLCLHWGVHAPAAPTVGQYEGARGGVVGWGCRWVPTNTRGREKNRHTSIGVARFLAKPSVGSGGGSPAPRQRLSNRHRHHQTQTPPPRGAPTPSSPHHHTILISSPPCPPRHRKPRALRSRGVVGERERSEGPISHEGSAAAAAHRHRPPPASHALWLSGQKRDSFLLS